MTWFKVDDTLHSHPKVRRAGSNAVGIWAMAGSFSGAYKTSGFVPDWWVREWGKVGLNAARKLVEVGLWDKTQHDGEPGYQFHDWDDYQPSSEEIERDREAARERQRRSRERKSRHAAGDHTLCDRCSSVTRDKRDKNCDNTVTVTRDITRDVTRESQYPDPTRPDPSRPDKGQGRVQGQGTPPEGRPCRGALQGHTAPTDDQPYPWNNPETATRPPRDDELPPWLAHLPATHPKRRRMTRAEHDAYTAAGEPDQWQWDGTPA